ncbi:MAG TPA: trypsin-like peptidase domain-containing protein [Nitriliruptorales bacterium]
MSEERGRRSWWDRIVGDAQHLGWWTLPVFALVGLTGAVLAGALTVVYYSQQVGQLTRDTAADREELAGAVDEVREAGSEALDAIQSEVADVRDRLRDTAPIEDVAASGVVSVRATVPAAAPDPAATGEPPAAETRIGSAFAVVHDGNGTFYATAFALLADPGSPGGALETVELITGEGVVTATVHSWDAERDLALLRAPAAAVTLLQWRAFDNRLEPGDRAAAVGVAPDLSPVQIAGQVGLSSVTALTTGIATPSALRGGPVVDVSGRVVGIVSHDYAPFGPGGGTSFVPVDLLCERMLRNCDVLQAPSSPSPTPSP